MNALHKIQSKLWWFTIPLALGLIWLVAAKVGWRIFFDALQNFPPWVWALTIFCTATELYVQLLRSWVMLRTDNPQLKVREVMRAGLAAFSAGSFTPGRVGDGALVLLLPNVTPRAVGIALVDRLMFWPAMHVGGMLAVGILLMNSVGHYTLWLGIAGSIGYLAIMEFLFYKTRWRGEPKTHAHFLRELLHGFTLIPHRTWYYGLLLGLAQYFIIMIQFQIGLIATGHDVGLFQAGVIFGSLQLLRSFFAFTPGNLGVSELIGMKLGELAGLPPEVLPSITIPFFLTNTVIPAVVGFPYWFSLSRKLQLRHRDG